MHNIKHIDSKKTSNFFLNVLYFIKQKYKVKHSINTIVYIYLNSIYG